MKFMGVMSIIGSILGGIVLLLGFMGAKSAPQEAASAALAIALAVIPYVFFRALQLSKQSEDTQAMRDALEGIKELPGAHGIFNMSPTDHLGLDQRSRVMVQIKGGAWQMVK